jgi:signal transduction histidine kinase
MWSSKMVDGGPAPGAPPSPSPDEDALVRGLLAGLAGFRWLAWAWLAAVLVLTRGELDRPLVAIALATAAAAVSVAVTVVLRVRPLRLLTWPMVAVEVGVAVALSVGDGVAYAGPHPQSLGSAWPLAGILTAGVAFAGRGGAAAGIVVGLGRLAGSLLEQGSGWDEDATVSALSTVVLYALAGGVAGFATVKLREAERRISVVQAREEVARTLHDGVLQTLAVVQRRAGDPELARLARDQERELREYLFGAGGGAAGGGLGVQLRAAAARYEDRFGGRAQVVVAPDLPALQPAVVDAVAGAVTEALTNAGKHGAAGRVTVYVGPDEVAGGVLCSVKDDGAGFDVEAVAEGIGLQRSLRARVAEVGGRTEIDGNPGHGTEVRLWVPG